MATMPSPQERPDLYDYYDNGDVTPDEKLSPFVKERIAKMMPVAEAAKRKKIEDAERAAREAEK